MQRISAALLLCHPGSHLPFLLADQDLAATASAGMVEGRGDLGWLRPGWGSQGFPGQGKGSRHCAQGGRQPKPRGVNLLPLNPAGWSSPRARRCWGAGPLHQPLPIPAPSARASAIVAAGQGQDCWQQGDAGREWGGQDRQAEGSQEGWLLGQLPLRLCLLRGWQRASSTQKAPSKVTLGMKPPLSHRFGGFVPLHRLVEAPSSSSAEAVSMFSFQGATLPTTSSWAVRSSTPRTPRVTSSARTVTSTSWGTGLWWWAPRGTGLGRGYGAGRWNTGPGRALSQNGGACVDHGGAWYEAAGCHTPKAEPPKDI